MTNPTKRMKFSDLEVGKTYIAAGHTSGFESGSGEEVIVLANVPYTDNRFRPGITIAKSGTQGVAVAKSYIRGEVWLPSIVNIRFLMTVEDAAEKVAARKAALIKRAAVERTAAASRANVTVELRTILESFDIAPRYMSDYDQWSNAQVLAVVKALTAKVSA